MNKNFLKISRHVFTSASLIVAILAMSGCGPTVESSTVKNPAQPLSTNPIGGGETLDPLPKGDSPSIPKPTADDAHRDKSKATEPPADAQSSDLEVLFTYGSEKEKWIERITSLFNSYKYRSASGRTIIIRPVAMGSGDCIDSLLTEEIKAHITSPASAAFVEIGNSQSQIKTGKPLLGPTRNLVLSPVVIGMWKPMAEALGWGKQPIGWSDIHDLAVSPDGWAGRGRALWGKFKFGHTSPETSNSGLIAVLAQIYAASGKTSGLTMEDVLRPETGKYLGEIQNSLQHYGNSTGFFGKKMIASGPDYLTAAVLYENLIIEANSSSRTQSMPLVAIYPKEGTFWCDHPAAVVERDWVTEEHRQAGKVYLDFLLDREQQDKAMAYGFRPANLEIKLGPPFDLAHGIDPKEPQTTLEVPKANVMNAAIELWKKHKKNLDK